MSDPRDLTGVWYGRYEASGHAEVNSFIALLNESGGAVGGSITEPDDSGRADVRRALVRGSRDGAVVRFVKQYDGAVFSHAVRYAGRVDEAGTEVSGEWSVWGSHGVFTMRRERFEVEEVGEEVTEEAIVEVR